MLSVLTELFYYTGSLISWTIRMYREIRQCRRVRETTVVLILVIIASALICPASATQPAYSAFPWGDEPLAGDAKAPVPVEVWQIPPLVVVLVLASIILPACLTPLEILTCCGGALTLNFRRIRKKSALDNVCRKEIHRYIIANPGAGFSEIERGVPVNRGTLEYHLAVLHRERLVVAIYRNNRAFYFENAGRFSDEEMDGMARMKNERAQSICRFLSSSPDVSQKEIARWMGVTVSTISWHLQRLLKAQLVTSGREGRMVRYRLTPFAAEILERITLSRGEEEHMVTGGRERITIKQANTVDAPGG